MKSRVHKIRPAGRHILTIGRDLIQDATAAIIELVKNSYDADSTEVSIEIRGDDSDLTIQIQDNGHGMDYDTVVNKWMVPSTPDKLIRRKSPDGRIMQGRKGIGRYAVSLLGNELYLETVKEGKKTSLMLDWNKFDQSLFLDDVEILIEEAETQESSGTSIHIKGGATYLSEWNDYSVRTLVKELRKLLSPLGKTEELSIYLTTNIPDQNQLALFEKKHRIEPFPILSFYNYRLHGKISSNGLANLSFDNFEASTSEKIHPKFEYEAASPGDIDVDLKIYDKDRESIERLIARGLNDPIFGHYLGVRETRALLKEISGVSIYREGFRIRPYGEEGNDWLHLDRSRIQNPSLRISNDQIVGVIGIEQEEISKLEEKSARDGLRDNTNFRNLRDAILECIREAEVRRFSYRQSTELGRKKTKGSRLFAEIENAIPSEKVFSVPIKEIESLIEGKLGQEIFAAVQRQFQKILLQRQEAESQIERIANELQEVMFSYESHLTLANIVSYVLHEGRKPVQFFRNLPPTVDRLITQFETEELSSTKELIKSKLETVQANSIILSNLFDKLDPLTITRRKQRKEFRIEDTVHKAFDTFASDCANYKINTKINGFNGDKYDGWEEDFSLIFYNLIENSIFWLIEKRTDNPSISVDQYRSNADWYIDFTDNGPGISKDMVVSGSIFEPGVTMKESGTGLGLSIAGEAAARNNCALKAIFIERGAKFRIVINEKSGENNE